MSPLLADDKASAFRQELFTRSLVQFDATLRLHIQIQASDPPLPQSLLLTSPDHRNGLFYWSPSSRKPMSVFEKTAISWGVTDTLPALRALDAQKVSYTAQSIESYRNNVTSSTRRRDPQSMQHQAAVLEWLYQKAEGIRVEENTQRAAECSARL